MYVTRVRKTLASSSFIIIIIITTTNIIGLFYGGSFTNPIAIKNVRNGWNYFG